MDVGLPKWWNYPTHCGSGHAWGPGRVIVSWLPCQGDPRPRGTAARERPPDHSLPRARVPVRQLRAAPRSGFGALIYCYPATDDQPAASRTALTGGPAASEQGKRRERAVSAPARTSGATCLAGRGLGSECVIVGHLARDEPDADYLKRAAVA